jgi:hypothetical protein
MRVDTQQDQINPNHVSLVLSANMSERYDSGCMGRPPSLYDIYNTIYFIIYDIFCFFLILYIICILFFIWYIIFS